MSTTNVPVPAASTPAIWSRQDLHDGLAAMDATALAWVQANWLQIVLAAGAGTAAYLLLNLARRGGVVMSRDSAGVASWRSIIGRAIARTGQPFMLLASIRLVMGYTSAPPFISGTIATLFTIAATLQVALWLREIVFGAIEQRTLGDEHEGEGLASALGVIRVLLSVALFAVALVMILNNVGVNVTGLVAGLGVGGIAIGLAAQGIFADLFAALAILFDRPFRVGDTISYDKGAGSGVVEAIGLKSTRIRAPGGEERIIANRKLLDFEILNATRREHTRFKFDFVLDYATSPQTVADIPAMLKDAVESEGYLLVHGGLNGFAPGGLSYDVEFQSTAPDFPKQARDKVAAAVLARFQGKDIKFRVA